MQISLRLYRNIYLGLTQYLNIETYAFEFKKRPKLFKFQKQREIQLPVYEQFEQLLELLYNI